MRVLLESKNIVQSLARMGVVRMNRMSRGLMVAFWSKFTQLYYNTVYSIKLNSRLTNAHLLRLKVHSGLL